MVFTNRHAQQNHLSFFTREKRTVRRSFWDIVIFCLFTAAFYTFLLLYIRPVDGINDDFGMYSTLSGAYLGYPDAHVLFFLYPLSWLLCRLYILNSGIPWYGLFQHGVHLLCIWLIYRRVLLLRRKHSHSQNILLPALSVLGILFFLVDFNVISEVQYTTTAGFAAATALFCFITTKSDERLTTFLKENIPTFFLAWLSFSMRQNVFLMMLPMAGVLWLSKWILSNRRAHLDYFLNLLAFAGILCLGMGILYGLHSIAYSEPEWSDFVKINHYRERVGDFYTWPEYEECSYELAAIGIDEETYDYMKNGAPYIGYQMSLHDWEAMHQIAKDCYNARTSTKARMKNILTGSINVFFYQEGMQPLNLCIALCFLITLFCILHHRNLIALAVYLLYLVGRTVTWSYLLYEGRFPKRIIQPLIAADFMILFGILLAFNLIQIRSNKYYAIVLSGVVLLSAFSVYNTKTDIDASYHIHQTVWNGLKEYCYEHPDNFYIWTCGSNTLDYYCESPFDTTLDTYQNFIYTNWGVICNPNSRTKLKEHDIENFGEDLIENKNVYFIFEEGLYDREHPVIMYFRHTYHVDCELTDSFLAGETKYEVYQLQ